MSMQPTNVEIIPLLQDARRRTLALSADLRGEQWLGPRLAIVNPPLWEIGHLAWFQEHWCLRQTGSGTLLASIFLNADQLYNSALVAHDTRWDLPLPTLPETHNYLQEVLQRVQKRLQNEPDNEALNYFAQLALFHEDMHGEAFAYTRQTLGYPRPQLGVQQAIAQSGGGAWPGDTEIPGGEFMMGAPAGSGFVFDNEKWAHPVTVKPFRMAKAPVSNAEFAAFVEDLGYRRREFWSEAGWNWRESAQAEAPVYWAKEGGQWMQRVFDQTIPLPSQQPVIHVNWFEADAWCRWAGRRLPSEAEWEFAAPPKVSQANLDGLRTQCVEVSCHAAGDSPWGCRQMFGNVWEWTADWFQPYPGFVRDPYKEYSEPWFGNHKVLRGGCFMTRSRLLRNTWRNFYTPDRRDVFAGFRTCAIK